MLVLGRGYLLSAPLSRRHTRGMCYDASLPYFLKTYLLDKVSDRMKSPTGLESANTLIVLALEEQTETRSRLAIPRCRG